MMTEKICRVLHPETRIVDSQKGIVDYVASDETIDSFREIIRADGWKFSNFEKNAPFVDSHDTSTIAKLCGKVIDFRVASGQLIERVQWAIGIGNDLADLGFNLTKNGFLKAVSVGFFPIQYLTPNSGQAWTDALKDLKLPADAEVRCIYTQQEQVELSACILGANPNSLAKARSDGIISDNHLDKFPQLQQRIEKSQASGRPVFSFPSTKSTESTQSTSREDFMSKLNIITNSSGPSSKSAFDRLETIRRGGSEDEISRAVSQARIATALEHRDGPDAIERFLSQPGVRNYWNSLARFIKGQPVSKEAKDYFNAARLSVIGKDLGVAPSGSTEAFLVAEGMSEQLFDLLLIYGAYKTLGLRALVKNYTKFSKTTGRPSAYFLTPSMAGNAIPADTAFAGAQLLPLANWVASLVNVSLQLVEDSAVDLSRVMVENFTQGLAARIDWACFQGTGANDTSNGSQTGIFVDATIKTFGAGTGAASVAQLSREDFIGVVGAVAAAALQRPCAWWIHPAFIPSLMKITEANGAKYVLKTPAQSRDGNWELVGFPVNWTAQAPSTDGPGQLVAAFGRGDSYLVNLSEQFIIESSPFTKWNTLQEVYRAYARVFCETRESTGLATLTTATH
jgi:HK97 family phage major capsid protein